MRKWRDEKKDYNTVHNKMIQSIKTSIRGGESLLCPVNTTKRYIYNTIT